MFGKLRESVAVKEKHASVKTVVHGCQCIKSITDVHVKVNLVYNGTITKLV